MRGFLERIESATEIMARDMQDRGYALKYEGTTITPQDVASRRGALPLLLAHSAWLARGLWDGVDSVAASEIARWFGGIRLDDSSGGTVAVDDGSPDDTPAAPLLLLNQESMMAAIRASPPMEVDFAVLANPPKSVIQYFMEIITHGASVHTATKDTLGAASGIDSPSHGPGA